MKHGPKLAFTGGLASFTTDGHPVLIYLYDAISLGVVDEQPAQVDFGSRERIPRDAQNPCFRSRFHRDTQSGDNQ
jgi:hypothetical protein